MLTPDVKEDIAALVRAGFHDKKRMTEIICEEMHEPGDLDSGEVSASLDAEIAKLESEKKTWPTITDCDRLESAFAALYKRGIIALHNAGNTQSDGYENFQDALKKHKNKSSILGYCFYHGQDLDRAVRGGGLFLAFGPADPNDEEEKGAIIGNMVRKELEKAKLKVVWKGTFSSRMQLPSFVWQRR
jgi:hypothetical protein